MSSYANGKIYKIVCNITGKCYIGSTVETLNDRLSKHLYDYKMYKKDPNYKYLSSYQVLESENYTISLVENFPCSNRHELWVREYEHVKKNDCVNQQAPIRSKKQYYEDNKEERLAYGRKYKQRHKEELKEKNKIYVEKNKDKILQKQKQYYQDNIEKFKEYRSAKFQCECGGHYTRFHKTRHLNSQKHLNFINNNK